MVSTRRRLALLGACIASLLLAAAFLGSSGSASAGPNRAGDRSTSRSDAAVPARPGAPSTSGRQQGAPGHARAARTAPETAHFEGAIDNSDPTQTDRLFRSGVPGTCAVPTSGALFGDATPRHYDLYEVVNNGGSPSCVDVTVGTDVCTGTNFIFSAGYSPTFNPANILENWQSDSGFSPDIGAPQTYSFNLAASAHAFINVHEVTPNAGCSHYTVDVNGADPVGGPPPPPPPPPPLRRRHDADHPAVPGLHLWPVVHAGSRRFERDAPVHGRKLDVHQHLPARGSVRAHLLPVLGRPAHRQLQRHR